MLGLWLHIVTSFRSAWFSRRARRGGQCSGASGHGPGGGAASLTSGDGTRGGRVGGSPPCGGGGGGARGGRSRRPTASRAGYRPGRSQPNASFPVLKVVSVGHH